MFLLFIFTHLKSKQALSEAKKSIKQTKDAPFHARSGNVPLHLYLSFACLQYKLLHLHKIFHLRPGNNFMQMRLFPTKFLLKQSVLQIFSNT